MHWEAHRAADPGGEPSLAEMTAVALERLERHDGGYLLMVEGGRIDHGHHASSAFLALHDTIAFSRAVDLAIARVDLSETLVVVTADHSHVFTIAGYPTRGNPILGLADRNEDDGSPSSEPARDALGLPYTTLGYANGPGHTGASNAQPAGWKRFPHFPRTVERGTAARPDLSQVDTQDPFYLQESTVPSTAETHAGEDVAIYAGGPGAALFHGVQEQSYVYHAVVGALGWDQPEPDEPGFWRRLFRRGTSADVPRRSWISRRRSLQAPVRPRNTSRRRLVRTVARAERASTSSTCSWSWRSWDWKRSRSGERPRALRLVTTTPTCSPTPEAWKVSRGPKRYSSSAPRSALKPSARWLVVSSATRSPSWAAPGGASPRS